LIILKNKIFVRHCTCVKRKRRAAENQYQWRLLGAWLNYAVDERDRSAHSRDFLCLFVGDLATLDIRQALTEHH